MIRISGWTKNILTVEFRIFFYCCTVHFEIYTVHIPTNALFINLVKSFKFTLKYSIISLLLQSFDCWTFIIVIVAPCILKST